MSDLARLEAVKTDIRCLLVSRNSHNVTLNKLNEMYKDVVEECIPYKDFYFTSLEKFLRSMPDVLTLRYNKANELCAYHIDTEESKHISSLVAREKPECDLNLRSKFKVYHVNPIDPHLLSHILQRFKKSSTATQKSCVRKTDVLSIVKKCIGEYAFYTIKDLNSQLNECTHILTHDDDYIYFKDRSLNDIANIRNTEIKNFCLELKKADDRTKKVVDLSTVSHLIKQSTKARLKMLIGKYTEGIWCSELPKIYQKEYGISLEYSDLGFNSIVEFVVALPDIFEVVETLDSKKLMVLDAKLFKNVCKSEEVLDFPVRKYLQDTPKEPKNIWAQEMDKYYKALIPEDVMGFDDALSQIKVYSLTMEPIRNKYHVIVSEIHNPSFFWITLCKNKKKITHLMKKLQKFYTQDYHNYNIPQEILRPGLHVACIFDEVWHRGIIKKFKSDGLVVIHFYDYGTSSTFHPDQLYFLNKKFSTLPAQAIPCSLHNVKPLDTLMWPNKVNKLFTKEVFDTYLVAYIISADEKNNSVVVDLVDRNDKLHEKYVSEWMITNKLAERGPFLCLINNIPYTYYQEFRNRSRNKKLNAKCTKSLIHKGTLFNLLSQE